MLSLKTLSGVACLGLMLLTIFMPLTGHEQAQQSVQAICRWSDVPVALDAAFDGASWSHAQVIPVAPGNAARPGRVKLLWDREFLHLSAELEGPAPLVLLLKPSADRPGWFRFTADPSGTSIARFHPQPTRDEKSAVAFRVETNVTRQKEASAWGLSLRIPWVDFLRAGGRPEPEETWQVLLSRNDHDNHAPPTYFPLRFAPPTGTSARPFGIPNAIPVTTSTVVGSPDPPAPYRVKRHNSRYAPSYPIMVKPVPGSDQLLVITEGSPYSPTALTRVRDDPAVTTKEAAKLFDFDGVATDFTFHPKFAENGFVYVGWNGPDAKKVNHSRVTRYRMDPNPPYTFDAASARTIIEWESNGHNGVAVCFGRDGRFYVTSGDGTSDSDTNLMGQRTDTLLSKVLRIDVDHPDAGKTYSVPTDNPFVGDPRFRPETWAYGLRNPWRMTSDLQTGHLWVGNNGQDQWEQAYLVRRGDNFGWSVMEGSHPFYPARKPGPTPIVPPTVEHSHAEFRSLTGGVVYYGAALPELRGAYLYGDYSTGRIWAVKHDGTKMLWHKEVARTTLKLTALSVDRHSELLLCDHQPAGQGGLYTLELTPRDDRPSSFPRKLSESGLFESTRGHRVKAGVIPYSVNAPFWSDGLYKERFIALPPGGRIGYTHTRGWNFPDRTVIIKSFAAEPDRANPAARHWVETRFLTKQDGEWFGYAYAWNAEQTDAELVESGGRDLDITHAGRPQRWRIPSRAECMVCHTRAANFVLGPCELQMNKDHVYPGGVRDNQLRVLEHLGVFECDWASEAQSLLRDRAAREDRAGATVEDDLNRALPQKDQRSPRASTLLHVPPNRLPALANPYDRAQELPRRARSWLHANCSNCHVEAGGGNAQMDLEFTTTADKMRLLDVPPLHDTYGRSNARLIAPGDPDRSVLLHRIGQRGRGQMPPLATHQVDADAVALMREWIRSLGER